ncbi:hypothetical protein MTP99_017527 [Tenebrio molitor]|jgi:hypothetical protein|uniref:Uncharacterized protein n=1 Tax=Tenebrio molitor TaxID=7067 RepID=A0A8J6HH73_TENMO|nr:hypothetical protein GEV33_008143 [Tenebrio molitor]KAJ3623864.1 hypothetical protein MTP99_017527 [Tenebrio molitor]CAH1376149.1 unnamed protein product [Tenebrio molitor]
MELANNSSLSNSTGHDSFQISDNTITFIIGFSILILFVILGMLASAFLCITLKKDPYLWEAERERQLHEQAEPDAGTNCKERDKLAMMDELHNQESTQI